jgi:hypothetical protein
MLVADAKARARQWVVEEGCLVPGYVGAFHTGSTTWLADDTELPVGSDVDVALVRTGPVGPDKVGKFSYDGVILEVTDRPIGDFESAERVLGHFYMAGNFRLPCVIADPSGQLTKLQVRVSAEFARRQWVRRRCEHARANAMEALQRLEGATTFLDQTLSYLLAAGVTTYVLLVAGLRNVTVRKRYVLTRELLTEYGNAELYERLLQVLGSARLTATQVRHHLDALTPVFDRASAVVGAPFFWSSDISADSRPIAIGGTRDLIERGDHREAVFWLAITYGKCLLVLEHGAPGETEGFMPGYRRLLADLGLSSEADVTERAGQVRDLQGPVWQAAEQIMAVHPEIHD